MIALTVFPLLLPCLGMTASSKSMISFIGSSMKQTRLVSVWETGNCWLRKGHLICMISQMMCMKIMILQLLIPIL